MIKSLITAVAIASVSLIAPGAAEANNNCHKVDKLLVCYSNVRYVGAGIIKAVARVNVPTVRPYYISAWCSRRSFQVSRKSFNDIDILTPTKSFSTENPNIVNTLCTKFR